MKKSSGHSSPNLTGGYTHYDSHGHKTGSSRPNLFGGFTNYDAKGHKVSTSNPNLFGGYTDYDNKGHKIGTKSPNLTGYTSYDEKGHKIGESSYHLTGGFHNHGDSVGFEEPIPFEKNADQERAKKEPKQYTVENNESSGSYGCAVFIVFAIVIFLFFYSLLRT